MPAVPYDLECAHSCKYSYRTMDSRIYEAAMRNLGPSDPESRQPIHQPEYAGYFD